MPFFGQFPRSCSILCTSALCLCACAHCWVPPPDTNSKTAVINHIIKITQMLGWWGQVRRTQCKAQAVRGLTPGCKKVHNVGRPAVALRLRGRILLQQAVAWAAVQVSWEAVQVQRDTSGPLSGLLSRAQVQVG